MPPKAKIAKKQESKGGKKNKAAERGLPLTRAKSQANSLSGVTVQATSKKDKNKKLKAKQRTENTGKNQTSEEEIEGSVSSEDSDDVNQFPTPAVTIDFAAVIEDAREMEWSTSVAKAMARDIKAADGDYDTAVTWSAVTASEIGGDEEFQARLCLAFMQKCATIVKLTPTDRLPKTIKEAKEMLKAVKNDNQLRICDDCTDGVKMHGHIRAVLADLTARGLEYPIACAFAKRKREVGEVVPDEFAGINLKKAVEFGVQRKVASPLLYEFDYKIVAARFLATFGDKDSCPIILNRLSAVRADPVKCIDTMVELGGNSFQPNDDVIENLTYQVVKVVNNMFDLKPKWTAAAMLDVLKNAFQLMEGVPREYWEAEVMCKVNHAIRDAASNYSHKREYSAIAELRRRLMVEFDLNLGAKGYGRSVKEGMTIWKAPCTSAEFIRALASIVQSDAGRKANLEKYNEASEGSQVKAVQQGGVLGKRKYEGGGGASKQGNDNNAKKKQKFGEGPKCYRCGNKGHIRENCHAKKHKDGGLPREYTKGAGKGNGNYKGKGNGNNQIKVQSLDEVKKKFLELAESEEVEDTSLEAAGQAFTKIAKGMLDENERLKERLARFESGDGEDGAAHGAASGGKGKKNAKKGKGKNGNKMNAVRQQQGAPSQSKKKKKKGKAADGVVAAAQAQKQPKAGGNNEVMRGLNRAWHSNFALSLALPFLFLGMIMSAEATSFEGTGLGRSELGRSFPRAGVHISEWRGRVHMRLPVETLKRRAEEKEKPMVKEKKGGILSKIFFDWTARVNDRIFDLRRRLEWWSTALFGWTKQPYKVAHTCRVLAVQPFLESLIRFADTSNTLQSIFHWTTRVNDRIFELRRRLEWWNTALFGWTKQPYKVAHTCMILAIQPFLESFIRFADYLHTCGCPGLDVFSNGYEDMRGRRWTCACGCARGAPGEPVLAATLVARASCVRENPIDLNGFGANERVFGASEEYLPWWDSRKCARQMEMTDACAVDHVKATRRRRKRRWVAAEVEAEDPWGGIYLWLLVLSGGFGAFVYGLDDLIITALMMREFVEGAAVLVACVCSTTLPAVVCASASLVWKFISLIFQLMTRLLFVIPLRVVARSVLFGAWCVAFVSNSLPSGAEMRRARGVYRRMRIFFAAMSDLQPRAAKTERELEIAQRLLNNRTIVERFLGAEAASYLPCMNDVFDFWFGSRVAPLFAVDLQDESAEANLDGADAAAQSSGSEASAADAAAQSSGGEASAATPCDDDREVEFEGERDILHALAADSEAEILKQCMDEYNAAYEEVREQRGVVRNLLSADGRSYLFEAVAALPRVVLRSQTDIVSSITTLAECLESVRGVTVDTAKSAGTVVVKICILVDSGAIVSAITLSGLLHNIKNVKGHVATASKEPPLPTINTL